MNNMEIEVNKNVAYSIYFDDEGRLMACIGVSDGDNVTMTFNDLIDLGKSVDLLVKMTHFMKNKPYYFGTPPKKDDL